MIRKLLLPAVAIALLGGCVTGYDYRGGRGDYYYGQPSTEYRYHGYGHYGYGYPYGGYPYGGYYGRGYYGNPYGGYNPYYPGYGGGYYPRPPIVVRPPRPGHPGPGTGDGGNDDDRHDDRDDGSPWRNLDDLRRRKQGPEPGISRRVEPSRPMAPVPRPVTRPTAPAPRPAVQPRRSSGSTMGDRLRELRSRTESREVEPR